MEAFGGNISSSLLLYHVLGSVVLAEGIPNGTTSISTVNGEAITVIKDEEGVLIEDAVGRVAAVTITNIVSGNGVIHIIDSVMAPTEFRSIVDRAASMDDLSALVSALSTAGLVDVLNGPGPFTVLAPTNLAFDAIEVPSNVTTLTDILLYHVIGADVLSGDLPNGCSDGANEPLCSPVATLNGQTVTPSLLIGAAFYDSMGRKASVETADIVGTNGVIHIVDTVLLPDGSINDVTENIPSLSSLSGALAAYGLNDTLDGEGTFTLFAPYNDGVADFVDGGGEIDDELLLYHVVGAVYLSEDVPAGTTANLTSLNSDGDQLTVFNNGGLFVRGINGQPDAAVITANIASTNGVVHIIDFVL